MKPSEIFNILDLAKRARNNGKILNVCFTSPPGLGKTEIVEQWCRKNNYKYEPMSLATADAPDFKGFPIVKEVNGRSRMSFATPDLWPDSGKGVIVLEELNRAPAATMQCVLSVGDARRGFDGYKLPEGWLVVACINEGEGYETTEMDHALRDRFEFFDVHYDKKTHLDYMKSTNYDPRIINFIESGKWSYKEPSSLDNIPGAKYLSPRTFSKLDAACTANLESSMELTTYEKILGNNIGKDFYAFCHNEAPVMMEDLKSSPKASLKKLAKFADPNNYQNGMISLTVRSIVEADDAEEIEDNLLTEVLLTVPVEQGVVLARELEYVRTEKLKKTSGDLKTPTVDVINRLVGKNAKIKTLFKDVMTYGKK